MKMLIVILTGTIGLTACVSADNYHSREFGFPKIYSDKSESRSTLDKRTSATCCTCCKESDPYVRKLPPEAQNALGKVGIKDIGFIAVIDTNGTVRLLKPDNVEIDRVYFDEKNPLKNDGLTKFKPIAMASYKSSHCFIWSDGEVDDEQGNVLVQGYGGPQISGGSVVTRICYVPHGH